MVPYTRHWEFAGGATAPRPLVGATPMRAIVTGQVGIDKKPYINATRDLAGEQDESLEVFHIGDMMYAEGRDIRPGRILDLPWSRLQSLRRAAFKDISAAARDAPNLVVNTHATFRWRHGLFAAIDFDCTPVLMVL